MVCVHCSFSCTKQNEGSCGYEIFPTLSISFAGIRNTGNALVGYVKQFCEPRLYSSCHEVLDYPNFELTFEKVVNKLLHYQGLLRHEEYNISVHLNHLIWNQRSL